MVHHEEMRGLLTDEGRQQVQEVGVVVHGDGHKLVEDLVTLLILRKLHVEVKILLT